MLYASSICTAEGSLQRAFSEHCLVPTLQVLQKLKYQPSLRVDVRNFVHTLEELAKSQIIISARLAYLNATQPRDKQDPDIPLGLLDDLLASLKKNKDLNVRQGEFVSPAAILFRIATSCQPRKTPKERRIEHSWLQRLFENITESVLTVSGQNTSIEVSCEILQIAVNDGVQFDSSVLEQMLHQLFEVFDTSFESHWNMLHLCMTMDSSVFAARRRQDAAEGNQSEKWPNTLLQSLSEKLIAYGCVLHGDENSSGTEQVKNPADDHTGAADRLPHTECNTNILSITTTLANAFANARDFQGFLDYWERQLIAYQTSETLWEVSVWEDPKLQQVIHDLVEPSLTVEQIEKTLLGLNDRIKDDMKHESMSLSDARSCISHLILLECVLYGCWSEATIQRLSRTVSLIYGRILHLLELGTSLSRQLKALTWKVAATINYQWAPSESYSKYTYDAAEVAMATVIEDAHEDVHIREALGTSAKVVISRTNYTEKLQAFRFILSFVSIEAIFGPMTTDDPDHVKVMIWIRTVLERFNKSTPGMPEIGSEIHDIWDGRSEPATEDGFAIASLALIVGLPRILE